MYAILHIWGDLLVCHLTYVWRCTCMQSNTWVDIHVWCHLTLVERCSCMGSFYAYGVRRCTCMSSYTCWEMYLYVIQEPVIQWLSFVYVLHICFSFIFFFFYINKAVSFELFYIVLSGPFIADYAVWALLVVEGRTVTYSC